MTERPILFSDAMVRAILAGTKTQTRRVLTPQPHEESGPISVGRYHPIVVRRGIEEPGAERFGAHTDDESWSCPYGVPGDRLWVRETHYRYGHWEPVATKRTRTGRQKWAFVADSDEVRFGLLPAYHVRGGRHHQDPAARVWHTRLARFMPRSFARTHLEVTSVRVERVQSISEEDARAEGVEPHEYALPVKRGSSSRYVSCAEGARHRMAFARLWNSINGKRTGCSWSANPWVWAITFKLAGVR